MNTWYENKAAFHLKEWEICMDLGKTKAAEKHQADYLNYTEMAAQQARLANLS